MDLVISGLVLEHVPQPADAMREMARVLSPGVYRKEVVIIAEFAGHCTIAGDSRFYTGERAGESRAA